MMSTNLKLMPLRIPTSWAITYNSFLDVSPGGDHHAWYFTEDLLQMEKMDLKDGKWILLPNATLIDLGWYPDGDLQGSYRLVKIENKEWSSPVATFQSTDRIAIQEKIEEWLGGV